MELSVWLFLNLKIANDKILLFLNSLFKLKNTTPNIKNYERQQTEQRKTEPAGSSHDIQ